MLFYRIAQKIYNNYKHFCIEITHGIFTSKVELKNTKTQFCLSLNVKDYQKELLLQNVRYFYIMLCDVYNNCNIDTKGIVLYRTIDLPINLNEIVEDNNYLNHVLPFSCSWNKKLVCEKWTHQYLLTIILPKNYPFLSLSHPQIKPTDKNIWILNEKNGNYKRVDFEKYMISDDKYFKIINQSQLEVLLPPCRFKLLKYGIEGDIINLIVKPEILDELDACEILDKM